MGVPREWESPGKGAEATMETQARDQLGGITKNVTNAWLEN